MDLKLEKWEITEIALNQIWEIDSGKWSSSNLETYDNSCFLEKQTRENFVVKWCLACIDSLNRESKQKAHLNRPLVSLFKIPKAKWDGGTVQGHTNELCPWNCCQLCQAGSWQHLHLLAEPEFSMGWEWEGEANSCVHEGKLHEGAVTCFCRRSWSGWALLFGDSS